MQEKQEQNQKTREKMLNTIRKLTIVSDLTKHI